MAILATKPIFATADTDDISDTKSSPPPPPPSPTTTQNCALNPKNFPNHHLLGLISDWKLLAVNCKL